MTSVLTIFLGIGVVILIIILFKKVILPQRAANAATMQDQKKIYQVIRQAKAEIDKDPQNAEANYLLGKALLADKREEQAYRAYRSASRLGIEGKNIPEIEFREALALLYSKFNEEEEALKEYVLLIKKNPRNPDYFYQCGKLFSSRGRIDRAEQYLAKAVSINPKESRYHLELGMTYYQSKKLKEASSALENALKNNPNEALALLYIGKIYKDQKEYNSALPYLEKAAQDQEYKLRALVELGACYMSLRMTNKAITELERAVNFIEKDSEPDSLYARYFLAMCHENTKDYAKAVSQWEKIYAVKKNFRDVGEKLTQYIEYRSSGVDNKK